MIFVHKAALLASRQDIRHMCFRSRSAANWRADDVQMRLRLHRHIQPPRPEKEKKIVKMQNIKLRFDGKIAIFRIKIKTFFFFVKIICLLCKLQFDGKFWRIFCQPRWRLRRHIQVSLGSWWRQRWRHWGWRQRRGPQTSWVICGICGISHRLL